MGTFSPNHAGENVNSPDLTRLSSQTMALDDLHLVVLAQIAGARRWNWYVHDHHGRVANSFDALYSQPMNTSALSPITTTTKKQVLSMTIIGIEIMRLPAGPGGD